MINNFENSEAINEISLTKANGEQVVIAYRAGEEAQVLTHLVAMVNTREIDFDWFDAAVMKQQLDAKRPSETQD